MFKFSFNCFKVCSCLWWCLKICWLIWLNLLVFVKYLSSCVCLFLVVFKKVVNLCCVSSIVCENCLKFKLIICLIFLLVVFLLVIRVLLGNEYRLCCVGCNLLLVLLCVWLKFNFVWYDCLFWLIKLILVKFCFVLWCNKFCELLSLILLLLKLILLFVLLCNFVVLL